jgi:hypothetical protein
MSNKLNMESLFSKISGSFEKASKRGGGGVYKDIMRFEKGKDYVVRLLPYVKDAEDTIYNLQYRGWKSKSTGKYVEFTDPPRDEINPIQIYSSKLSDKLKARKLPVDDPEMKRARDLWSKNSWLINCYVVSDPTNPDNEGQVKILKLGKKLYDIVYEHVEGDRSDEFGMKCFNPTSSGCNFKIRVVDNGAGYANYDKSYFMQPSEIEGLSDNEEKVGDVLDSCFELKNLFPSKSTEELEEAIQIHFEGNTEDAPTSYGDINDILDEKDEDEDEDEDDDEEEVEEETPKQKKSSKKQEDDDGDDDLDSLLADL